MKYLVSLLLLLCAKTAFADLTLATWNMQWLVSEDEFVRFKEKCEALNWKQPDDEAITDLPPCNAYSGSGRPPVPKSKPIKTITNYRKKVKALKAHAQALNADVIAVQEVSGEEALRAVLPSGYQFCFSGRTHVQNVGFAIRDSLTFSCRDIEPLSLEDDDTVEHKVRRGVELTIENNGRAITILNVHLKSGCAEKPLNEPHSENEQKACPILAKQVPRLEAWMEEQATNNKLFAMVGDFNRKLIAELGKDARSDGSDPTDALTDTAVLARVFPEISDNAPPDTRLHIVRLQTSGLTRCHSGIDHILLGRALQNALVNPNAKAMKRDYGDPHYGMEKPLPSDHCPILYRTTLVSN